MSFLNEHQTFQYVWGEAIPYATGSCKDWERGDRLHEIRVRTLTIGSQYDEIDPDDMRKMARPMPNASNAFCPNGSHLCMWDDQAVYFNRSLDRAGQQ